MRILLLTVLISVALLQGVVAEGENEVKRGSFPFMAFLYYSDETILDNDLRFTRSAALINDNWLISSADVSIAFPQKTLLARLGAINIDMKLTLNEDEDEQEREIILILRPYNYNASQWWKTDITLLKTLLPFNETLFVTPISIANSFDVTDHCYILVYAKLRENGTERALKQMNVKLLPPMTENCGNYFEKDTMVCAADSNKDAETDDFCQGNNGGPLVCNNNLTGLQTYINDCKQPHLYQYLMGWNNLITCAAENRYLTQSCADICVVTTKDPPIASTTEPSETTETTSETGEISDEKLYSQSVYSETVQTPTKTDATETSSALKADDTILSSDMETMSSENTGNKEESTSNNSPSMLQQLLHSTSTSASEVSRIESEATMESTDESGRRSLNKPRHEIGRGEASQITHSLFHYLVISFSVLAYT